MDRFFTENWAHMDMSSGDETAYAALNWQPLYFCCFVNKLFMKSHYRCSLLIKSSSKAVHVPRSWAICFQWVRISCIPYASRIKSTISSVQRLLGRPTLRLPSCGTQANIRDDHLPSILRARCPANRHFLLL